MKVLYIDPQSVENMAVYDFNLLSNISAKIIYCCSSQYNTSLVIDVDYRYVFNYYMAKKPFTKGLSYLLSLLKILWIAKKEKPDVIHIQWWRLWIVDYLLLFLLRKYTDKIVFTAHNTVPHESGDSMNKKCMKYYSKVDKIIVHTRQSKDELISDFGVDSNKIFVIPHGLLHFDVNRDEVEFAKSEIKENYKLNDCFVFSALGNQSYYKGTDLIKEAFFSSSILKNNPYVFLLVGGKGDIISNMDIQYCSNIYVKNKTLTTTEFQAFLELTDVLLLPYRRLSQSGVLLTALELCIPYLATNKGGLSEPLQIAPVGWILKNLSIDDLREAMEKLVLERNNVKACKANQNNWGEVHKFYNWSKIAKLTMLCYKSEKTLTHQSD